VVVPALARPYCDRCGSWFRTTRAGTIEPQTARRLAELVEADVPGPLQSARYRLRACRAGCGPTELRLVGFGPKGDASSVTVWLDPAGRSQIVQVLDQQMKDT
jgi:hypothetical protein